MSPKKKNSLVLELQQEALNGSNKVSDLLRKASVVATKLNAMELKNWLENELNGYRDEGVPVPTYRKLRGQLKAIHPQHGIIPFTVQNPKLVDLLIHRDNRQAIAELEGFLEKDDPNSQLIMEFSQDTLNRLDNGFLELGIIPVLVLDRSVIWGVLNVVRNTVLNWSLELEKDKILGEGLTFSAEEKQSAAVNNYHIENLIGVAGNVQTENLQIGDYNTIHSELKRLGVSQDERNELECILDDLKSTSNPDKKESLISKGQKWLQKHADTIGSLSHTIQGWLEFFKNSTTGPG